MSWSAESEDAMKKLTLAITLGALLICLAAAHAQEEQRAERRMPEFERLVQVNLVLLDIIVTDGDGNYVPGLTTEDFEVFENGRPVTVAAVDEYFLADEEAEAVGGRTLYDSPPRNVIFILDKFFSSSYAIARGKEAIIEFIRNNLQPGDRGMILTYERRFRVVQELTTDHRLLEMAVLGLQTMSLSADTPEVQMSVGSDADAESLSEGTAISNENPFSNPVDPFKNVWMQHQIRMFLEKLQLLSRFLRSMPGRKTVILMSEGYDERFIVENTLSRYRNYDLLATLDDAQAASEAMMSDPSGRQLDTPLIAIFNDMVRSINDASTSFYVVDLSSFGGERARADQFHQQSSMQRIDYNTQRLNSLASIADNSGGRLYSGSDLSGILGEINNDISNYYIISYFTPDESTEGRFRRVEVRPANSAFSVRTRRGYFEPRSFERMDGRDRLLHLVEGMFRAAPASDLTASSSIFFLPLQPNTVVASLAIEIPADQLSGGGDQSIELIGTAEDQFQRRLDAFHKVIDYGDQLEEIRADGCFRLKVPMLLSGGFNRVRVTVRDNSTGRRYYVFDEYITWGAQPDSVFISSIALFDEDEHRSSTEKYDLRVNDRGEETGFSGRNVPDPLRITVGRPIFPLLDLTFSRQDQPVVFFSAGNFWLDEETGEVDFFIDYNVINPAGEEIIVPVDREQLFPIPGTSRINVISRLVLSDMEPGEYRFRVRFLDRRTLQGVQRELPITIR